MRIWLPDEEVKYEVIPIFGGKKVLIYLKKSEQMYIETCKPLASHFLEQIFKNDVLVKGTIKENPYYIG